MSTNRKYGESREMVAAEGQLLTPTFPSHAGDTSVIENKPEAWPLWRRAMAKAGIMPNTQNQFPRINPTVIALLAFMLPLVIALVAGGIYVGRLSAAVEQIPKLDKKLDDNNVYWEAKYSDLLLKIEQQNQEIDQPKRGKH